MSTELPSESEAIATKGCSKPTGIDAVAGVTCNEVTTALVTVTCAVALKGVPPTAPEAVIVALPWMIPVTSPAVLTVATATLLLLQLNAALSVTSRVLPSDSDTIAVNGCSKPTGTGAVGGMICSEVTTAAVTVI